MRYMPCWELVILNVRVNYSYDIVIEKINYMHSNDSSSLDQSRLDYKDPYLKKQNYTGAFVARMTKKSFKDCNFAQIVYFRANKTDSTQ